MTLRFPDYIFSPKELTDLKRRVKIAGFLKNGKTWKETREKTGGHMQTIALVAKRLKQTNLQKHSPGNPDRFKTSGSGRAIFLFGAVK